MSPEYWKKIATCLLCGINYILLFTLTHDQKLFEYAQKLSMESGLQLVIMSPDVLTKYKSGKNIAVFDAGPEEFLGYIANADLVLTDSFHGTVFSLIMQARNFYSYISDSNQRGSRITDLLKIYGLESHLINLDLVPKYEFLMKNIIDHGKISRIIHEERVAAQDFLYQAIECS